MTAREKAERIVEKEGSCVGIWCTIDGETCPLSKKYSCLAGGVYYQFNNKRFDMAKQWIKDNQKEGDEKMTIQLSEEELRKIIDEQIDKREWREVKVDVWPACGCWYFYIDDCGDIDKDHWDDVDVDNWRRMNKNIFKTEDDARKYRDITIKLHGIITELGRPSFEDWNSFDIEKHYIFYDFEDNEIKMTQEYFTKENHNLHCIEEYRDRASDEIGEENLIWYFTYHIKNVRA